MTRDEFYAKLLRDIAQWLPDWLDWIKAHEGHCEAIYLTLAPCDYQALVSVLRDMLAGKEPLPRGFAKYPAAIRAAAGKRAGRTRNVDHRELAANDFLRRLKRAGVPPWKQAVIVLDRLDAGASLEEVATAVDAELSHRTSDEMPELEQIKQSVVQRQLEIQDPPGLRQADENYPSDKIPF